MRILFPIISGSEIRQIFLSGVARRLLDDENVVYTIVKYDQPDLIQELHSIEPRVIILPFISHKTDGSLLSYVRTCLDFNYDQHHERWRYSPPSKMSLLKKVAIQLVSLFIEIPLLKNFLQRFEYNLMMKFDVSGLKSLFKRNKVDKVIVNNARFLNYPELLVACLQLKIPVAVLYHSNKEVFAQPRIGYPYNKYGVWNSDMNEKLLINNPEIKGKSAIVGNTHFAYLKDETYVLSKEVFFDKYKIRSENSFIVLYTAAGLIIKNEFLIVKCISDILKEAGMDYKIIVRRNPMDTTNIWDEHFHDSNDVIIQHPLWVMDQKLGMNYTLKKDLIDYSSLLKYMTCCINIPSTVTIEAAIVHKPVINICYNFPGVTVSTNKGQLTDFWLAPFYQTFHSYDFVKGCFSIENLIETIMDMARNGHVYKDFERCTSEFLGFPIDELVDKSVAFITEIKNGKL